MQTCVDLFFLFKLGWAWAGPSEAGYFTTFMFQRKNFNYTQKKTYKQQFAANNYTYSRQKKK